MNVNLTVAVVTKNALHDIFWRWLRKLCCENAKWLLLLLNIWTLLFDVFHYVTPFDPNARLMHPLFVSDTSFLS